MFSTSASSVKLALPTPAWTMPAFSTRNSTWPPLAALPPRRRRWSPCRASGSASGRAGPAPCRAGRRAPSCRAWRCSGRSRSGRPGPSRPDPRRRRCRRRPPWPLRPCRPWRRRRRAASCRCRSAAAPRRAPSGRLARIDAEVHGDLDGLVELRLGARLDQLHRLVGVVERRAVDAFVGLACKRFPCCHRSTPPPRGPSTGPSRRSCCTPPRGRWR